MEELQGELSKRGELIISQEPYVSVANNSSTDSKCEKADWKLHRLECQVFSHLDKDRRKSITSSIRLMVKLYLRQKLQSENVLPVSATDNYNLVAALVSHMSDIDETRLVLYAQMANLVSLILQWPSINLKEIAENFSRLACNAHTICDSELRPMGTGLYPIISIINHSCLANAVLIFEGRLAVVRAVQHIPKGTEVLISYIETAGSTITRQKALKEQYLFNCTCPRCVKVGQFDDIQESAVLEGYRCKDGVCNGFLLCASDNKAFVCQACGLVRDKEEVRKVASEVKLLKEKASLLFSSGNHVESISIYKMVEELQKKLCHPLSIDLTQTQEALLKDHVDFCILLPELYLSSLKSKAYFKGVGKMLLMELKDWKEALAYCRLTIPVYERVYPGYHPLRGLQYYTSGKLEWFLGETDNAIKSFTKAADILRITHGTNTTLVKDLLIKLEEARAEASYKPMAEDENSRPSLSFADMQ
ncbi:SET domain, partial [Dillenia turbinata]